MDLSRCQIFTPEYVVKYMLDKVNYIHDIQDKKIIDNSCGDGRFLVEILHRLIEDANNKKISKSQIKFNIEKCLYGYEIDPAKYNDCINNLDNFAFKYGIKNVQWNIYCSDGLEAEGKSTFDFVVGNPPYIAYKDLDKDTRLKVKSFFSTCKKGKFDYSYAFIEKGLNLISSTGKMIIISPSNMFKTVFGKNLRGLVKPYLLEIVDCGKENIFNGVLTSPSITVYSKGDMVENISYQLGLDGDKQTINKKDLNDKWVFEKKNEGKKRFGDYFKVSNSIATLANNIFIHNLDGHGNITFGGSIFEEGVLRTAKSPRSEKYGLKQKIIFPYKYIENTIVPIEEQEFEKKYPNAYGYLLGMKKNLDKRDKDQDAKWYAYGRSQALLHLNQPKLMISSIVTNHVNVYEMTENEIPYSGFYIISKSEMNLQEAKKILESKRFYQYLLNVGILVSGNSRRISTKDIEKYRFED